MDTRPWILFNPLVRKRVHPLVHQLFDLEIDPPSFFGTRFFKKPLVLSDLVSQADQDKVGNEQSINWIVRYRGHWRCPATLVLAESGRRIALPCCDGGLRSSHNPQKVLQSPTVIQPFRVMFLITLTAQAEARGGPRGSCPKSWPSNRRIAATGRPNSGRVGRTVGCWMALSQSS